MTEATAGPGGRRKPSLGVAAPLQRPAPLRQVVYDTLVELIINRTLRPGQHLVEADLAQMLGVSRQPVREALQRLQTEGWVDLRPAQGAFVHVPTDAEADDLLGVRTVLEAYSARLAASRATDADNARLKALYDAGMAALADDDTERLVTANADLHAGIAEVAGNAVLTDMIRTVDRRVRWLYTPIARPRGRSAWQEHARLLKAIAAGDQETAAQIMTQHTDRTRQAFHDRPAAS